jgi:hypothetical protein
VTLDASAAPARSGSAQGERTFAARARPSGLIGWSPRIVGRSLAGAFWYSDATIDLGEEPGVGVDDAGLHVRTGWYAYDVPWSDVRDVYAPETNDPELPRVLCVARADAPLIVLTDLALGAGTEDVVREAARYRWVDER